jgi:ribosomal protein L37AE/L43A
MMTAAQTHAASRAAEDLALEVALASVPGRPVLGVEKYAPHRGGMEGGGFSAILTVDGKRAALLRDDGNGGSIFADWTLGDGKFHGGEVCKRVAAYADAVPPTPCYGHLGPMTLDYLLAVTVSAHADRIRTVKGCKTKVIWRTAEGVWMASKGLLTAAFKARITAAYPGLLIANEAWAGQSIASAEEADRAWAIPKCAKAIVFRTANGQWRTLPGLWTVAKRDALLLKYPGAFFANGEWARMTCVG